MEAWLSWALVLAISGALYYYYSQNSNRGKHRGRPLQRAANTATTKEPIQWDEGEAKSKSAAKPAKAKAPRRSVKKAVQEVGDKAESYLSAASSTAGADADDDLSPVTSPSLGATTAVTAPSGRDVSDMLESHATPSVLKISASEKPARPAKPQQKRSETPQETKRQKQNREKKERERAAREEAEKERKILEENQRRRAREARGEAARNGLQSAQAPTSNPWNRPTAPVQPVGGQLLDTIDATSTASSSEAHTNGTAPTPDSMSYANLPSEEEQMRLAMEESAWTTVPKVKKQRKNKAGGETAEEGSDSGAPQEPTPIQPAPVKAPVKKTENVKPASRFEVLSEPTSDASHPMDSDWPVV
ncbi:hypothetical protein BU26DRAFT_11868 [Trematosphaeria pertusa]|uniref:Uncharacterized protein n=1 Tax=Trematosphaeria pertusa TaxID=390896 RepID=A0A6A6IZP4_9PLEO|nr:uncharacterized protein BU26DRAFT_11868 [Trematosphaeria pertusa]KAF2255924.1 hypothetical protein BU26DRAFT_11868 [Trematosphaeria pertusa]